MLSDLTVSVAASEVYSSVGLNAMESFDLLNMGMSVKEFPTETVLSFVVLYLFWNSPT